MYEVKLNGVSVGLGFSYPEAAEIYENSQSNKKQMLQFHTNGTKAVVRQQLHHFNRNKVVNPLLTQAKEVNHV